MQAQQQQADASNVKQSDCPQRTKSFIIIVLVTLLISFLGPFAMISAILFTVSIAYSELISIGNNSYKLNNLKYFQLLSYILFVTSIVFCIGQIFHRHTSVPRIHSFVVRSLFRYYLLVCMTFYIIFLVLFVLSLVKKNLRRQFLSCGYMHISNMLMLGTFYIISRNVLRGYIWQLIPIILVIINDTCAYVFGRCFGKHSLIQLSKKKTIEGFIGALFMTLLTSLILPSFLAAYPTLTCPVKLFNRDFKYIPYLAVDTDCKKDPVFNKSVKLPLLKIYLTPFSIHCFFFGLFTSIIGPFGGFLASGFKRAYGIKDFGTSIPGHGGVLDRFDVLIFVSLFVSVYTSTFVKPVELSHVMNLIEQLSDDDKLILAHWIKKL